MGDAERFLEIAAHEAAHAVIAAHLGLSPIWVEIDPVRGRGEMTPETPWCPATSRQKLLIAQAGSAAQCRLNGVAATWTIEGANDRLLGDGLAKGDPAIDPNNFNEIISLLACRTIWERIERLAHALLVQNRIEVPALRGFLGLR